MDELAMILLTVPIFFPVVTAVGYDPIWFGVIIVVVVQIGLIAPPVGLNVFVIDGAGCAVGHDLPRHPAVPRGADRPAGAVDPVARHGSAAAQHDEIDAPAQAGVGTENDRD